MLLYITVAAYSSEIGNPITDDIKKISLLVRVKRSIGSAHGPGGWGVGGYVDSGGGIHFFRASKRLVIAILLCARSFFCINTGDCDRQGAELSSVELLRD